MNDTLTQSDVQLHTGTDPEKHAHIILVREYVPGEQLEALCGHRFVPSKDPNAFPVCEACLAVVRDDEARYHAAGYSSLPQFGGSA